MIGTYLPPKQMHLEAPVQEQDEPLQEVELAVGGPTQPFLQDVLTTIPGLDNISYSDLTFVVSDMLDLHRSLDGSREEREQAFLAEFKAKGIIPSNLRLKYSTAAKRFVEDWSLYGQVFPLKGTPETSYDQTMDAIASGGRIHKISFATRNADWGDGYKQLVDDHLPRLAQHGYALLKGDVWLAQQYSKHGCYDDGGYDPVSSLHLLGERQPDGSLLLITRPNWSIYEPDNKNYEGQDEYRAWFRELAGKHNLPVEVHPEQTFR